MEVYTARKTPKFDTGLPCPKLEWSGLKKLLATQIANVEKSWALVREGRDRDRRHQVAYRPPGVRFCVQSFGKHQKSYKVVILPKKYKGVVREAVYCDCPGTAVTLAELSRTRGLDKGCLHCGACIILSMIEHGQIVGAPVAE